jgi:hypothetical protein
MYILSDEFSRQASMESELDIQSSLLAPPKKDLISLSKNQLGFMNLFAIPLFQGVADVMPAMRYTVEELEINKALFEQKVRDEQAKEDPSKRRIVRDGTFSPRTMSFATNPDASAQKREASSLAQAVNLPTLVEAKTSPLESESPPIPASPAHKPPPIPTSPDEYKSTNGHANNFITSFDAVADFAASDPFNCRDRQDSTDQRMMPSSKQRCSETTDGSTTGPYSGDWASQATSATTGKMPLSPSTQGTSIVSRDSLDRPPSSVPATALSMPEVDSKLLSPEPRIEPHSIPYESTVESNGNYGKPDGNKIVKKKSSRFRMNAFPFFRRHRGSSPSMPAADTAG